MSNFLISNLGPLISALIAAGVTFFLTRRREVEAGWRAMRLAGYQEFVRALSGIVEGRESNEAHIRYADAVNAMLLFAPPAVLHALDAFASETSVSNQSRSSERHDQLLSILLKAMRQDVFPQLPNPHGDALFRLRALPPRWITPAKTTDERIDAQ
ncbi:hypothetical protein ISP17_12795 [Dyella ginsengisoli]|uniref:Uncharacterized protein n=1 Tax=Dyella ginsengisoli TaxID=363848 RepID=A0ABW8JUK7_9GAMM